MSVIAGFDGGPACGQSLTLARAPRYLRVVTGGALPLDALDQLDDDPAPGELVHVYRAGMTGFARVHIRGTRGTSGCYSLAPYVHMPDVAGDELRDRGAWREWCRRQVELEAKAASRTPPIDK